MTKHAHEIAEEHGLTRERLSKALARNDNWGGMVNAFEYLTACSALLAAWPEQDDGSDD